MKKLLLIFLLLSAMPAEARHKMPEKWAKKIPPEGGITSKKMRFCSFLFLNFYRCVNQRNKNRGI